MSYFHHMRLINILSARLITIKSSATRSLIMHNPKPCMEMGTLQDTGVNPLNTKTFTGKLQSSAEGRMRHIQCNGLLWDLNGIPFVKKGPFLLIVNKKKQNTHGQMCCMNELYKIWIFYWAPMCLCRTVDSKKSKLASLFLCPRLF